MSYPAFFSTVFLLLLSPGPTNTLMGLASARDGLWRVSRLLPAEIFGYLTTVLPLAWLGGALISRWPETTLVMKVATAVWVMYLAVKLWTAGYNGSTTGSVTAQRIFLTTTLNPKALVFGLVLLPRPTEQDFLPKLAIFIALASIVAMIWGVIGRLTQVGVQSHSRLFILQRAASLWLAIAACTVFAGLFQT